MVSRLLLRAGLRYHAQHPIQLGLTVLGVALGVAVVVAVDIATGSARRAFTLSTEAVSGRATHEIIGGPGGLPDSVYTRLRVGLEHDIGLAPVVDRHVRVAALAATDDAAHAAPPEVMRLLGIDPFVEAPFRSFVAPASGDIDLGAVITGRALLMGTATAARLGVDTGDTVVVHSGTGQHPASIAALLEPAGELAVRALDDVVLADIATAQELTSSIGVLDRIELRITETDSAAVLADIRALLPDGVRVADADTRTRATLRLTRAFDTNLTALALVALVFGMFLIYNSMTFSLVQRRPLIGLLRAQGVTARELLNLLSAEAVIIGAAASALGLAAGYVLATQLLQLVARTINDLYFSVSVTTVHLDAVVMLRTGLVGVAATVAAALPPALEAVRTRPRVSLAASTLERRSRRNAGRLAGAGVLTGIIAAALLAVPSVNVVLGFTALFVLILAAALVTPAATVALMAAARPLLTHAGPVARMAAGGVSATLSRTAPAIAALSVAIAVGIAVTIMISSFRAGVVSWLDRTLEADLYVSAPGFGPDRFHNTLDPQLAAGIAGIEGVAGVSRYRHVSVLAGNASAIDQRGDFVTLIAIDLFTRHRAAFELLDRDADAWQAFERGGVFVSEPISFRRGITAGDSIELPTDRGSVRFPVAAVFRDYSSEHGLIFMDRAVYDLHWSDDATTSLAVFVEDGADTDAVLAQVRRLPAAAGANIRSNAGLRNATLQVFDRTFVITGVLRLLALIVAFVGVTGALMALQLERRREIAMLRAVGLTPGQVWTLVTTQTALMGLAAAALAMPLGLAMSWAMVNVINRRSFGWSFEMLIGAAPFVQGLAVGIGAAVLAGVYPAWRNSRDQAPALPNVAGRHAAGRS